MVPAIEWHLLHPHSMRSSFGSVGPKFVPPPHAPGSPPCCQQVGPPKTTCKEGKWPKQSIQGSCGCPCSLLGIWTRWPLGIPSNSDHCVSGGKTQDFSIPFGGYLAKKKTNNNHFCRSQGLQERRQRYVFSPCRSSRCSKACSHPAWSLAPRNASCLHIALPLCPPGSFSSRRHDGLLQSHSEGHHVALVALVWTRWWWLGLVHLLELLPFTLVYLLLLCQSIE